MGKHQKNSKLKKQKQQQKKGDSKNAPVSKPKPKDDDLTQEELLELNTASACEVNNHVGVVESQDGIQETGNGNGKLSTIVCGLMNVGNTCYFNSVIQCLVALPQLYSSLASFQELQRLSNTSTTAIFFNVLTELLQSSKQYVYNPSQLLASVAQTHSAFGGRRQQDSHEFLRALTSLLSKEASGIATEQRRQQLKLQYSSIEDDIVLELLKSNWNVNDNTISILVSLIQEHYPSQSLSVGLQQLSSLSLSKDRKLQVAISDTLRENIADGQRRSLVFILTCLWNGYWIGDQSINSRKEADDVDGTWVYNVFGCQLTRSIECLSCHNISNREETILDLSVAIQPSIAATVKKSTRTPLHAASVQKTATSKHQSTSKSQNKQQGKAQRLSKAQRKKMKKKSKYSQAKIVAESDESSGEEEVNEEKTTPVIHDSETQPRRNEDEQLEETQQQEPQNANTSSSRCECSLRVSEDGSIAVCILVNELNSLSINSSDSCESVVPIDNSARGTDPMMIQQIIDETKCENDKVFNRLSSLDCSLVDCLAAFTSWELLLNSNAYACPVCTDIEKHLVSDESSSSTVKSPARSKMLLATLPNILTIHLKRFAVTPNGKGLTKLDKRVQCPLILDLSPYISKACDSNSSSCTYSLYGFVSHSGSLHGGHYVAYVRRGSQWWFCSDSHISKIAMDDYSISQAQPFLLFYQRNP